MWRCKECDGKSFREKYTVFREGVKYGEDGEVQEWEDQDEDGWLIECDDCGNDGCNIKRIAEWTK